MHPSCEESWALDWIFVVDALNFCFWKPTGEIGWTVDGYTGYFALCAAINRAMKVKYLGNNVNLYKLFYYLQENIDIVNPKFYATITEEQLKKILRSDTDVQIPLFPERIKVLHEVGSCLLENFEGSFENVVKQSGNSAVKLLNLIVDNFKCFRDEATYKDEKVAIYKRAQILVGDIWACHKNQGIGHFKDIEEITMFADYRVPQSLLYYGVFEYSDKLNEKLKKNQIFNNGDEDEVEIRACSIRAVDQLVDYAKGKIDKDKNINAILVDHFLWDFRRAHAKEIAEKALPFHLTLSIYY